MPCDECSEGELKEPDNGDFLTCNCYTANAKQLPSIVRRAVIVKQWIDSVNVAMLMYSGRVILGFRADQTQIFVIIVPKCGNEVMHNWRGDEDILSEVNKTNNFGITNLNIIDRTNYTYKKNLFGDFLVALF